MGTAVQNVLDVIRGHRAVVRHLRTDEKLPATIDIGFDKLGKLDCEWIWVAERSGEVEACMVTAPCHGMVFIYRLAAQPGCPFSSLAKLLRESMRELRQRGVLGFMTFLDLNLDSQRRLFNIIKRCGGQQVGPPHAVIASPLVKEGV